MRVLPRSRWGKGLALVAIVLIALDVMTIFGTLAVALRSSGLVRDYSILVGNGGVRVARWTAFPNVTSVRWEQAQPRAWLHHGPKLDRLTYMSPTYAFYPLWYLWLPAIVGVVLLERRHAKRNRTSHECDRCRYDLTGLPPEAVCPECGLARW